MAFSTKVGKATVYVANDSPGEPVCAYGTGGSGEGLSVEMYFGKKGKLKGVVVYDGDAEESVAEVGKVPADRDEE